MHDKIEQMRSLSNKIEMETHKFKKRSLCMSLCDLYSVIFAENTPLNKIERKLARELEIRARIKLLIIDIRSEGDTEKCIKEYKICIQTIGQIAEAENDEKLKELWSSIMYCLKGKQYVKMAMKGESPNRELMGEAIEQFKSAKDRCKQANMCYYICTVLFELERIDVLDNGAVSRMRDHLENAINSIPEKMDNNVKITFEGIKRLFESRHLGKDIKIFDSLIPFIMSIKSKELGRYLVHIIYKIMEPFSPDVRYTNWRLDIKFDEPEKVQGTLTIKAGDRNLFCGNLEKSSKLYCEFTIPNYYPQNKKETLIFTDQNGGSVKRYLHHSEKISYKKGHKSTHDAYFTRHDCNCSDTEGMFNIAIVQLKYHLNKKSSALVIDADKAYHKKIAEILETVRGKANIVVFPEFSIPFDYLDEMQTYSKNTGIVIVAGSHYVTADNIKKYDGIFQNDIGKSDLLKNISPVIIPSSKKILHTEKILPAKEERELFNENGMENGTHNRVFKLNDQVTFGVMICFDFMNPELRMRFNRACNIILVPQANPGTKRFHDIGENSIGNTDEEGNKTYIMASAIFTYNDGEEGIMGGNSGAIPTLDGATFKKRQDTIIEPIKVGKYKVHEQFIQLASLDMDFITARDAYVAQTPITCKLIHIFEKNEMLKPEANGKNPIDFLKLLETIKSCDDEETLIQLFVDNESLIYNHSPRMHKTLIQTPSEYKKDEICEKNEKDEHDKKDVWNTKTNPEKIIYNLKNLTHDKIKEKCASIVLN